MGTLDDALVHLTGTAGFAPRGVCGRRPVSLSVSSQIAPEAGLLAAGAHHEASKVRHLPSSRMNRVHARRLIEPAGQRAARVKAETAPRSERL